MLSRRSLSQRLMDGLRSFLMAVFGVSIPAFIVAFFTPSIAPAVVAAFLFLTGACLIAILAVAAFDRLF